MPMGRIGEGSPPRLVRPHPMCFPRQRGFVVEQLAQKSSPGGKGTVPNGGHWPEPHSTKVVWRWTTGTKTQPQQLPQRIGVGWPTRGNPPGWT